MQLKWKRITKRTILMLLACFLITSLTQSSTILIAENDTNYDLSTINYIDSGPIIINNDADLLSAQNGGDGSSGNPYLISNYNITAPTNNGIYITGTTLYFKIETNLIQASDTGIVIDTVAVGTALVTQNIVISSDIGIKVLDTPNILISFNNCTLNANQGIYLDGSPHCEVLNNTCNNNWWGVGIYNSNNCTVSNNTASYNEYGMEFDTSESAWIEQNTVTSNTNEGIYLNNPCHYSTFTKNYCYENFIGISIDDSNEVSVIDNTCIAHGGEALYILRSNYPLATLNTLSFADTGLAISRVENGTFSNNIIRNSTFGISAVFAESNEFYYNLIKDNDDYGIYLSSDCYYNTIHHNAFINNQGSSSQAYDAESQNIFYDTNLLEGNYWSNWFSGNYQIDGGANEDPYPLNANPIISEFNIISIIVWLFLIISTLSIVSVFRKK